MQVSSIILSGGLATRMGGVDKGLVTLQHKPLVQHLIDRLAPQTDEILINANRELPQYQALGYPVLQDDISGFIGPLAGFLLGLQYAKYPLLLTVPCDSPLIPTDLCARLLTQLTAQRAEIAVACSDGDAHPVFSLCLTSALPSLQTYVQQGGRKVSAWQKSLRYAEVDFSDQSDAFVNLNTLAERNTLEAKLSHAI
jgi:molybdopterin-guanine dinucleotide biosynthesis protein A